MKRTTERIAALTRGEASFFKHLKTIKWEKISRHLVF